jgi:hypothetical protein
MKPEKAKKLGLNIGSGRKTPEELRRRLQQRATVVPDKSKEQDRRACRERTSWDD